MHKAVKRKKKAPSVVDLVYLVSRFACGRCGDEIETEIEAVRSPGTGAILEEQEFEVHCAKCGWKGKLLGKHRLGKWQARPPR